MKSKRKTRILVLIILGFLFALSPIFVTNLSFTARDRDITSNYNDEFDHDNFKISGVSGKIHIDGNSGWAAFKAAGNCTGSGNYTHPYIIEDLIIEGDGTGSCVLIENSDVYFRIENCSIYNGNTGIFIYNCINSILLGNNASNNLFGIRLTNSENIVISGNIANYNYYYGISLGNSNDITVTGNIANYNSYSGIILEDSFGNNVSGNTVNYNNYNDWSMGIDLYFCNGNIVSGNTVNNNHYGIHLYKSNNSIIRFNIIEENIIGICLKFSYSNEISNNTFNGNNVDIQQYFEPKFTLYELVTIGIIITTVIFSGMHYITIFITRKRTAKDENLKKVRIAGLVIHIISLIIILSSLWWWNKTAGSLASISAGIGLTIGTILIITGLVSLVVSTICKKNRK
jgi:parallel beta-helix repeat protein